LSSNGRSSPAPPVVCPYQPPAPCPQRLAWAKISMLEPKFMRFLDILSRVFVVVPFLEALKKAPTYLNFLREILSKKGETRDA